MEACIRHSRDLLEAAKAVEKIGKRNIAYHLATLSLEELGRRELIAVRSVASEDGEQPPWLGKASQDHVKKLFWCFYGLCSINDMIDQAKFFESRDFASSVHANRLAGLYVGASDDGLGIPSEAISVEQAASLIDLASAALAVVEVQSPLTEIPTENFELQAWLVAAFDDPRKRERILSTASFAKLRELQDVVAWTRWLRSKIDDEDAQLRTLMEAELRREAAQRTGGEERWKVQLKFETHSHSLRPGPIKKWNEKVRWIKLGQVQGSRKKQELFVDLILGDNVPMQQVWDLSLSLGNLLLMALNLATSGFWWWALPRHKTRFYEKIEDLKNGLEVRADRLDLKV